MESYSREEVSQDFLGRGWKFPPQVDETTGRIRTVGYEEDIAEAIRIILFTRILVFHHGFHNHQTDGAGTLRGNHPLGAAGD